MPSLWRLSFINSKRMFYQLWLEFFCITLSFAFLASADKKNQEKIKVLTLFFTWNNKISWSTINMSLFFIQAVVTISQEIVVFNGLTIFNWYFTEPT